MTEGNKDENALKYFLYYHELEISLLKHYEESRTKLSQIILALSAALIGLSKFVSANGKPDIWVSILVAALGLAGIAFAVKYSSLAHRCTSHAKLFRNEIGKQLKEKGLNDVDEFYSKAIEKFRDEQSFSGKFFSKIPLRYFWICLHALVLTIGVVMTINSLSY